MILLKDLCVFTPLLMTQKIEAEGVAEEVAEEVVDEVVDEVTRTMAVVVRRAKECPVCANPLQLVSFSTPIWKGSMRTDVPLGETILEYAVPLEDTMKPAKVKCALCCALAMLLTFH